MGGINLYNFNSQKVDIVLSPSEYEIIESDINISIQTEQEDSLISPSTISKVTTQDIKFINWCGKNNNMLIQEFLNIAEEGMFTYFKKEDMEK